MRSGILAHRGHWTSASEKNTRKAFERAFVAGFGIETDIRDVAGELVIAHDPPTSPDGLLRLPELVRLWREFGTPGWLALNIKSDGLAEKVARVMAPCDPANWFVFDMSVPDAMHQLRVGNPLFVRASERETPISWFPSSGPRAAGIWLDALQGPWCGPIELATLAAIGCPIAVVSEELHGRANGAQWEAMKSMRAQAPMLVCTDLPEAALQQLDLRTGL